jgi:hypothetical protein
VSQSCSSTDSQKASRRASSSSRHSTSASKTAAEAFTER